MHFFDTIISSYSWVGVAFVAMVILLLSIQLFYYIFRFGRLGKYLNKRRAALHEVPPPISLVIPMFSEDYDYLDNTLPLLLTQELATFEVVIVYVGSNGDFFDDMLRLKTLFHNITVTKIELNDRFPISIKTTLNIGIKASKYEHILFSTTDSRPSSERWLSLMARGFQRGDVVLGYSAIESEQGRFGDYFMRVSRLVDSTLWLSSAIKGAPYRAIRSNMGFTRSLYFKVKGFNRLNMNIGVDDLFMQSIMTQDNVSVVLSPRASVIERCWGGFRGWIDSLRYFGSAVQFYPLSARNYVAWEMVSRVLFFLLCVIGVIFLPLELKVLILLFAAIRIAVVLTSINKVAKRVGERGIVGRYIFFDMMAPLFALYMQIKMLKRDKRVWR
ncbi:MAG: glycosyltransferase [Rikenellaceae bacterium]